MPFSKGDLVWYLKSDLWWPAQVVDDEVDDLIRVVPIEPMKKKSKKLLGTKEAIPFEIEGAEKLTFQQKLLRESVQKAIEMKKSHRARVLCNRINDKEDSKSHQSSGGAAEEASEDWKTDFLASLDDDEEEEKERKGTKETTKTPILVKLKMSAYDVDPDDDGFDSDKENDPKEDQENKIKLDKSMTPVVRLIPLKMKDIQCRTPLKELTVSTVKKKLKLSSPKRVAKKFVAPKEELSEYEKIRQKNIMDRQALFAALKIMTEKNDLAPKPKPRTPGKYRRSLKVFSTRSEPYRTRRRLNSEGVSPASSEENTPLKKSKWNLFEEMYSSGESDDENSGFVREKKRYHAKRWCKDPNTDFLQPEDVTDAMLENVAKFYHEKVYSPATGTTCHQCRQKTLDTKTVCRSGRCVGGRGVFCGVCLPNRYGEDAREALKDPNWMCPPCLDVCNCSICRNRIGKGATGPITYLAQSKGFSNVKDFLESLKRGRGQEIIDEDE